MTIGVTWPVVFFFKLNNPDDAPRLESYLNKFVTLQNNARPDYKITRFAIESLPVVSRRSEMSSNGFMERPEDSAAYGPFVLAILILISACLNFANTTVARSNSRLREMGVRKVMGGTRAQLMYQMLSECSVVVFIAILISIGLNKLWFPVYNKMWTYLDLQANYTQDHALQIFLLSALIGTTVFAGAYPAFYISRFNPTSIFRGSVKFGGTNLFSRLLLGLQVVIALITVIAGVSFARNADFQKEYDFGYARDHILVANVPDKNTFSAFQNALRQNPNVVATCGTRQHMGYNMPGVVIETEGQKLETRFMRVGEGYLDIMELKTATGRVFDTKLESDYTNAMMITEKLSSLLGWTPEDALGKQIRYDTTLFSVIGVLKDFHATELFNPIEPVALTFAKPEQFYSIIVRAEPENPKAVMDDMRTTWNTQNPLKPFFGIYQNDMIAEGADGSDLQGAHRYRGRDHVCVLYNAACDRIPDNHVEDRQCIEDESGGGVEGGVKKGEG